MVLTIIDEFNQKIRQPSAALSATSPSIKAESPPRYAEIIRSMTKAILKFAHQHVDEAQAYLTLYGLSAEQHQFRHLAQKLNMPMRELNHITHVAQQLGSNKHNIMTMLYTLQQVTQSLSQHNIPQHLLQSLSLDSSDTFNQHSDLYHTFRTVVNALAKLPASMQQYYAEALQIDTAMLTAINNGTLVNQLHQLSPTINVKTAHPVPIAKTLSTLQWRLLRPSLPALTTKTGRTSSSLTHQYTEIIQHVNRVRLKLNAFIQHIRVSPLSVTKWTSFNSANSVISTALIEKVSMPLSHILNQYQQGISSLDMQQLFSHQLNDQSHPHATLLMTTHRALPLSDSLSHSDHSQISRPLSYSACRYLAEQIQYNAPFITHQHHTAVNQQTNRIHIDNMVLQTQAKTAQALEADIYQTTFAHPLVATMTSGIN